jgi:hypothetical protein
VGTTARIRARDGGLVALVLTGIVAISVAAHAHQVASNPPLHSSVGVPLTPKTRQDTNHADTGNSHPFHFRTHLHVPGWVFTALGQIVLAAAVLLLVFLLVKVVPQIRRRSRRPKSTPPAVFAPDDGRQLGEQVSMTVEHALAGLRRGDREQAIIACWLRLQDIVESAGYPPAASQTSSELVARWQQGLPLSRPALTELAELYREARFSSHRMSAESLQRASSALGRLRADVQGMLRETGTDG